MSLSHAAPAAPVCMLLLLCHSLLVLCRMSSTSADQTRAALMLFDQEARRADGGEGLVLRGAGQAGAALGRGLAAGWGGEADLPMRWGAQPAELLLQVAEPAGGDGGPLAEVRQAAAARGEAQGGTRWHSCQPVAAGAAIKN